MPYDHKTNKSALSKMDAGYKNPLKIEKDCNTWWKTELEFWHLVTDIEKINQALTVELLLTKETLGLH